MAKREPPRMTDDDIKDVVRGLVTGHIFTATDAPDDLLPMIFLPLGLAGNSDIDWETVGNVIERLDKAGERGINGYPIFLTCRLVHKDDWSLIAERALKAAEALEQAVEGAS